MSLDLLLIDDSLTDLAVLKDMITASHLTLSVAFDGEVGYQQAELQQPGLILLDVRMPGMDGFTACRLLKTNPATRAIPVIFLTAANDLEERLEGFALGAVDYIGKPFAEQEVMARIGVHLNLTPKTVVDGFDIPVEATRDEVLVRRAQKILRDTLAHPPSLPKLAELLCTNRTQLNLSFQARCGQSVFGWLYEERLRQAYYLVCRTDTPMSHIAEHLGYATQSNFAKSFRERFGFPPRDLRRGMILHRDGQNFGAKGQSSSDEEP